MLERQRKKRKKDIRPRAVDDPAASKGAGNYPHVFIIGMEEEDSAATAQHRAIALRRKDGWLTWALPAPSAPDFTYAARRRQFAKVIDCLPSRFLYELPSEDLENGRAPTTRPPRAESRQRAKFGTIGYPLYARP